MKIKNLLLTVIVAFGFALILKAQSLPNNVPENGLIGWWSLDGNANDSSGNNLDGDVIGSTELTSDRFGQSNSAYDFDYDNASFGQQNDEIYIPYDDILNVNNITVSVWVYPRQYFWSGNPGTSDTVVLTRWENFDAAWRLWYSSSSVKGAISNGNSNITAVDDTSLNLNTWNHIVMSYDSQNVKLYVNGVLKATATSTMIMNTSGASGISIGEAAQYNGYWHHTDGKIDDIGIWDRALTDQEITDLYVGCQLSFINQPEDQEANVGEDAVFNISSSNANTTYQWQSDIGFGFQDLTNAGQYGGVTTNTLTVSNTALSNNNQIFRCIIDSGICSETSQNVTLTVNDVLSTNDFVSSNSFKIYPNPTSGIINISSEISLKGEAYEIYDIKGVTIKRGQFQSNDSILNLESLNPGIYILRIGNDIQTNLKIVKN